MQGLKDQYRSPNGDTSDNFLNALKSETSPPSGGASYTEWTVMGSECDEAIYPDNATNFPAGPSGSHGTHKIVYELVPKDADFTYPDCDGRGHTAYVHSDAQLDYLHDMATTQYQDVIVRSCDGCAWTADIPVTSAHHSLAVMYLNLSLNPVAPPTPTPLPTFTPTPACVGVVNVPGGGQFCTKWTQYGGLTGILGRPYANWMTVTGGQQQIFTGSDCGAGSSIFWSLNTGTVETHGCINNKYRALGGLNSGLGFPTTDVHTISGATAQTYEHGIIFDTQVAVDDVPNGGAFYTKWTQLGGSSGNLGTLGRAYSDWKTITGGQQQIFVGSDCGAGSSIYWSTATGTHEIHGCINNKLKGLGGVTGSMGFPTTDQYDVAGGQANGMQGAYCGSTRYGHIWDSPATDPHETNGCIDQKYVSFGGPGSVLGFPTSDEYAIAGGHASDFTGALCYGAGNGHIYSTGNGAGTHEVHGCIATEFLRQGGPGGWMGFPTSDVYAITGGRKATFQNGYIIEDTTTGVTAAYPYPCTPGVPC
jgi:uncharacterized protein with LGFP repeats